MLAGPSRPIARLMAPQVLARTIQTTPPLPPPVAPLPPSTPSTSTSALPPLLPPRRAPAIPSDTSSALALLKAQSTSSTGIYLTARLHSRTYLLHPRDILTVPTLKPLHPPGTTLALTRILEVGSRDWSIRSPAAEGKQLRKANAQSHLNEQEFESLGGDIVRCDLTVLEHTKSPMEFHLKTKRRKGYKKTIQHKQGWTRLRVGDIILGDVAKAGVEQ